MGVGAYVGVGGCECGSIFRSMCVSMGVYVEVGVRVGAYIEVCGWV